MDPTRGCKPSYEVPRTTDMMPFLDKQNTEPSLVFHWAWSLLASATDLCTPSKTAILKTYLYSHKLIDIYVAN